ncbi:ankyrin repeat and SOCS box protein 14-like isoform X2 [Ischnura elegans]|nr:ankyrin repeat and SOCS box protein 14-like isoform X2 [Ischnura elegans]
MGLQPLASETSARVSPSAQAELLTAIKNDSVDDVKRLLPEAEPEWTYGHPDNGSCLYIAAKMGFVDVASVFIEHKADVNGYNATRKNTPLHTASELGHSDMVKLLIAKGGKLDTKDAFGRIPLHLAAKGPPPGKPYGEGHLKTIKELIAAGSPKNAKDRQRNTPLLLAVNAGHKDAVELLISSGANPDTDPSCRSLIKKKMPDLYVKLPPPATHSSPEEDNFEDLLFDCVYERKVDKFKALLPIAVRKGLDLSKINDGMYTLLQYACENMGLEEFVSALLDSGVCPNATWCGNKDKPLLLAAYQGNSHALSLLVDHNGTDLTVRDKTAETALHKAVKMEKIEYEGRKYKECIDILSKGG